MTTLLLIRHGQSVANINCLFAGHTDAQLSELGIQQAHKTAEYIRENYQVDEVYASDLQRAHYTGKATADLFGLPVIATQELREIFGGDWENLNYDWLEKNYADSYGVWLNDVGNARCNGGESVQELGARIYAAIERIAKENDGKTVVIATHATPVRVMECMCKKIPFDQMSEIPWVSNASVTEIQYENGNWVFKTRGYDAHLCDLKSKLPANV